MNAALDRYFRLLAQPQLRDYQAGIVRQTNRALEDGARRVLVESMTGSGKTTIGARLVSDRVYAGQRVLWLAHREELITQAKGRIEGFGVPGAIIKAGHPEHLGSALQVGSVQSVVRRLRRLGQFDSIFVDEAHHALSASYVSVLDAFPDAETIGLTATPWRLDGRGLGEVFDTMVVGPNPDDLIAAGHILPARVIGSDRGMDFSAFVKGREYSVEAMEEAIGLRDLDGDAPSVFLGEFPTRGTAAAFCRSVVHAEKVCEDFRAAGVPAAVVSGETPTDERAAVLAALEAETIRVVCCVDVISEGYDLPAISSVILLRKTKSLSLFLQQAGRALRPSPGKTEAVIFDLVGNSLEHGHPCSAREWTLEGVSPSDRAAQKTADGEDLSVRRCDSCFGIHKVAPVCPYCGHEHTPDDRIPVVKARELREIEKAELEALQEQRRKERKQEERGCKSLADWRALGAKRGYKPGWAITQWRLRT